MEAYIHDEEDFTLADPESTTLIIQPGFVEPYRGQRTEFEDIQEAFADILSETREQCTLLWNGIPLALDYPHTISTHLLALVGFLEKSMFPIVTPVQLEINYLPGTLLITAYERENDHILLQLSTVSDAPLLDALVHLDTLLIERSAFFAEWKLLLQQLLEAFLRSEVKVRDISLVERIHALNQQIPQFGKLYSYLNTASRASN